MGSPQKRRLKPPIVSSDLPSSTYTVDKVQLITGSPFYVRRHKQVINQNTVKIQLYYLSCFKSMYYIIINSIQSTFKQSIICT
jgi:hypothetical protein